MIVRIPLRNGFKVYGDAKRLSLSAIGLCILGWLLGLLSSPAPARAEVFAVFGDSLAKGMAQNLDPRRVLDLATVGYGLGQADFQDRVEQAAQQVQAAGVHRMLVLIGTNDVHALHGPNGLVYDVGSAGWAQLYTDRLAFMRHRFLQAGARIAWIGIPPMNNPHLNAGVQWVQSVEATLAHDNNDPFIPVDDVFRGRDLHTPDGIHFQPLGYALLAGRAVYGLADLAR